MLNVTLSGFAWCCIRTGALCRLHNLDKLRAERETGVAEFKLIGMLC